jgi:hypothetical protein
MPLLSTTRFVSMRFRLLVCFALDTLKLCGFCSHFRLWRARLDGRPSSANDDTGRDADSGNDPQVLMARADHFYWLNNGPRAAPLYGKAEQLFTARGDTRNAIHAKVGRLRSEAETMSFVQLTLRKFVPRKERWHLRDGSLSFWSSLFPARTPLLISSSCQMVR